MFVASGHVVDVCHNNGGVTDVNVTPPRLRRTPWFNGWGFNLPRGQSLLDKWNLVPEGIDILMTHGPPLGESN